MRRCFYYTDLRKNAVFHNFSRQLAFLQYSGPSKHAWAYRSLSFALDFNFQENDKNLQFSGLKLVSS